MYTVTFKAGHKMGEEKYLREDGTPFWVKTYTGNGDWTWQNYDASGKKTTNSEWKNKTLLSSDVPDPPAKPQVLKTLPEGE
jgi:antitoxin component YwqK of YwqJK toxin-antitoxin module